MNFDSLSIDALANFLISVDAQQIEQVMGHIGRIGEIRAYRQYNNIYNIRAVAILKNLNELDKIKAEIRQQLPTIAIRTYIWTAVKNIPENLQLNPNQTNPNKIIEQTPNKTISNPPEKAKIDDLDLQIIEKLALNGRAPFTKIAKELNTTTDTVIKRYRKNVKKRVIKVSIQIDPNKLGYCSILDFNLAFLSPVNSSKIVGLLAQIPDVIIITKTSGDYDLQVTAMIRDLKQMFTLQEEIARIPGITKIETSARKIPNQWPTPKQYISTF
jgi:Lrp/AsnC family transcriptional regulator for asnA, asnC and gidA